MLKLSLTPLRTTLAMTALVGVTAIAPAASAAPGKKSQAKRAPLADLVLRDLEVDYSDDSLEIYADVTNRGKGKAGRSDLTIAISSDERFDPSDAVVDEVSIKRLKAGRTKEIDTEIEIPDDEDLPAGDVYLVVCADGNADLREVKESNNCAAELIAEAEDDESYDDTGEEDDSYADGEDDGEEYTPEYA